MSQPLVRLRSIDRRFGLIQALSGADLDLYPGEVHGVLGANGAGKSTLLKLILGRLEPYSGTVSRHPNLRIGTLSARRWPARRCFLPRSLDPT